MTWRTCSSVVRAVVGTALVGAIVVVSPACGGDDAALIKEGEQAWSQRELARLKRDIYKVDKSINVTKELIRTAKGERYLPDLYFRLAELHIEKSRLVYFRILEEAGAEDKTAVVAPEARLLKDQAIAIYRRILSEFPDYPDNDKIRFFIAHEFRELGKFDDMLKTYRELIDKHPKSTFRYEAWLIMGDYHFDKGDVDEAMKNYNAILANPETYAHNMARYKLGWCFINKDSPKKAVDLWEAAVRTPTPLEPGEERGADGRPRLDVRRDALKDLAFYYAESRNPKTAVGFFDEITESRQEYQMVLQRLATRFQIKTMYKEAADVYRELIRTSGDLERQLEWAQQVYEATRQARDLAHADDDVVMLSDLSARLKFSWRFSEDQKLQVNDFEQLARDLATRLHQRAKERNEQELFQRSARAYKAYLSVFEDSPQRLEMEWNHAEAMFEAKDFVAAGQQYEKVMRVLAEKKGAPAPPPPTKKDGDKGGEKAAAPDDKKPDVTAKVAAQGPAETGKDSDRKQAMYSAVVSYFEALKKEDTGSRFDSMMAREGIKSIGALFVQEYPADSNTPNVKFNIARAYYEQGQFEQAIELFTAFVQEYPGAKDAPAAAELALDSYAQKEDFAGLAEAARKFAGEKRLADETFRQRFAKMAEQAEQEEINRKTIAAEGNVQEALATFIVEKKGTEVAAKALHQAFVIARDRRNFQDMIAAGRPLLDEYGNTKYAVEVLPSLAEQALRISQVEAAASYYEDYALRYPNGEGAPDFLEAAATIRYELGEFSAAMNDYEKLIGIGAPEQIPRYQALLAKTAAEGTAWRRAESAALNIIGHPAHGVLAGAIAGEVALKQGDIQGAVDFLSGAVELGSQGQGLLDGREWFGRAQYLIGEIARQQFEQIQFGIGDDGDVLASKFETLSVVEAAYVGAIQAGDPTYALGGLYRVAAAYRETADFLDGAPVPDGLTPDEEAQYRAALKERSDPLRAQAQDAITACQDKAKELDAFNRFVKACMTGEAVDEDADKKRPRPSGASIPGREQLEEKLVNNPKDLGTLKELIRSAIAVQDHHLARLLALRALELNDKDATLHNLLGVATFGTNQRQAAAAAFKDALKRDRDHAAANKNLAALYTAYGNPDKAQRHTERASGAVEDARDVIRVGGAS